MTLYNCKHVIIVIQFVLLILLVIVLNFLILSCLQIITGLFNAKRCHKTLLSHLTNAIFELSTFWLGEVILTTTTHCIVEEIPAKNIFSIHWLYSNPDFLQKKVHFRCILEPVCDLPRCAQVHLSRCSVGDFQPNFHGSTLLVVSDWTGWVARTYLLCPSSNMYLAIFFFLWHSSHSTTAYVRYPVIICKHW